MTMAKEFKARVARARSLPATYDAVALDLNRGGLLRGEGAEFCLMSVWWLPLLVLGIAVGGPTALICTPVAAVFGGFHALVVRWPFLVWRYRIPPVVVDARGIDLQASGRVPWEEVRTVVIDRRRISLELMDCSVPILWADRPAWFTRAHHAMRAEGGTIDVPLRWVHATPQEIATEIRRGFAKAPIRVVH